METGNETRWRLGTRLGVCLRTFPGQTSVAAVCVPSLSPHETRSSQCSPEGSALCLVLSERRRREERWRENRERFRRDGRGYEVEMEVREGKRWRREGKIEEIEWSGNGRGILCVKRALEHQMYTHLHTYAHTHSHT